MRLHRPSFQALLSASCFSAVLGQMATADAHAHARPHPDGVINLPLSRFKRAPSPAQEAEGAPAVGAQVADGTTESVPLADYQDNLYIIPVQIGDSNLHFQLDSGSADLWSFTSDCSTEVCKSSNQPKYSPSSSLNATELPYIIHYGAGIMPTYANGTVGYEKVRLGSLDIPDQAFAQVSSTNNSIVTRASGIWGVGFPEASEITGAILGVHGRGDCVSAQDDEQNDKKSCPAPSREEKVKANPFLARLAMQGLLKEPMFSLSLERNDPGEENASSPQTKSAGQLTLGGLPTTVANSSLTWLPLVYSSETGSPGYWGVPIEGASLNGSPLPMPPANSDKTPPTAVIDSGTSFALFPPVTFAALLERMPSYDPKTGLGPCDDLGHWDLSFRFAGKDFHVDPADLVEDAQQKDDRGRPLCYPKFTAANEYDADKQAFNFLLGDTFMKNVLTAFYYGDLHSPQNDPPRLGMLSLTPPPRQLRW